MRILLTADTVGGVWDFTRTLATGLASVGHEVLVAVLGPTDPLRHRLPAGIETVVRPYRLEWMPAADEDVNDSTSWIADVAGQWGAEIVHVNQFSCALGDFAAPVVVTAHSDVLSWFSESLGAPAPGEWDVYAERVRLALRTGDVVVAPTAYQSALLARHYGHAADHVVHNGSCAVTTPDLASREPFAVCAARAWDSAKGVGTLDSAADHLGSGGPIVHLLGQIEAPGGERFEPRFLQVHGTLPRAEVDRWFSRAAIYAAPSLYEPFGLAPLEAALHGCALVLSDIGSFRELWDGCAEFVPAGDPVRLAEALSALAGNPARLQRLAALARGRAERWYTTERMVEQYLDIYAEMVHTPRIRAATSSA